MHSIFNLRLLAASSVAFGLIAAQLSTAHAQVTTDPGLIKVDPATRTMSGGYAPTPTPAKVNTTTSTTTGSTAHNGSASTNTATTASNASPTTPYSNPAAGQAAQSASKTNGLALIGAAAGTAAGALLMKKCFATKPVGMPFCIMGGISFAAAGISLSKAFESKKSAKAFSMGNGQLPGSGGGGQPNEAPTKADIDTTTGGDDGDQGDGHGKNVNVATCPNCAANTLDGDNEAGGAGIGAGTGVSASKVLADYYKLGQQLKGLGIAVSPDGSTVTLPDGRKIAAASMNSDAGMKAAGFSDDDISSARRALGEVAAATAEYAKKANSLMAGSGGGGGGGSGEVSSGGGGGGANGFAFNMPRMPAEKAPLKLNNLKLGSGDDVRGAATNDIWAMVNEQYKFQEAERNAFLK